jgi:sigma-B regulation protein RsbU (phosphoserine phosphatase)
VNVPPLPRPHENLLSAYAQGLSSTEIERLFTRDTPEAYRFFSRHIDLEALAKLPWYRRWVTRARMVFLAVTMRLSPGRRALYGASLVAAIIGLLELFQGLHLFLIPHPAFAPGTLWLLSGFLLLNLLMLIEVADRLSLKNDLEVARQIQLAMLPRAAFHTSGLEAFGITRPANTVGGDFYDILALPDGRVVLALGDVAGKGSPAALLMALLLAMMRTLVDEGVEGPALVGRLNYQIMKQAPRSRFVTLFVGVLDPTTGALSYVNAGQNPPLVRRGDGRYDPLREGGVAVGMFEQATYEAGTTQLAVGDVLVMFSDGVVEAEDASGQPFDEAGVRATVDHPSWSSAKELAWALVASVQRHTDDRRLMDDLTALVARRLPPLPRLG